MAGTERVQSKEFETVNIHFNDLPGFTKVVLIVPPGPGTNCCISSQCAFGRTESNEDPEPKVDIQERGFSVMVDATDRRNNLATYKAEFELQEPITIEHDQAKDVVRTISRNRVMVTVFVKSNEPMNSKNCMEKF
ncbi:uncharacterized protein LOC135488177 [Lineus longissimus]|uniref:uncharacterized protein LOC135488177 n=1 Tax=Lineus longissimus TaxID=88925 RepID=UPI002B4C7278